MDKKLWVEFYEHLKEIENSFFNLFEQYFEDDCTEDVIEEKSFNSLFQILIIKLYFNKNYIMECISYENTNLHVQINYPKQIKILIFLVNVVECEKIVKTVDLFSFSFFLIR